MLVETIILERLLLAVLLGGILGFEREHSHKVAGLRTHSLVCLASTLITLVAVYGFGELGGATADTAARIVSQVVLGVGFIGAGVILHQGAKHVSGITTSATLWVVAIVGIAIGMDFLFGAILTTLISYLLLVVFKKFEIEMNNQSDHDSRP